MSVDSLLDSTAADSDASVSTARAAAGTPSSSLARWTGRYVVVLVLLDVLAGSAAIVFAAKTSLSLSWRDLTALGLAGGLLWPFAVLICRGYERARVSIGTEEMRAVFRAAVAAIATGAIVSSIVSSYGMVATSVLATAVAVLSSLAARWGTRTRLHQQQRLGRNLRRLFVVGSAWAATELSLALARDPRCGMLVVGTCAPSPDDAPVDGARRGAKSRFDSIVDSVLGNRADAVAVTASGSTGHQFLRELAWRLEGLGVELLVHPGLVEVAGPRMHIRPYVGLPLLHVEQPNFTGWRRFCKRAVDVVLTSLGLVVAAPLLLAIALAVKLEDGGSVIFRQTRVGLAGQLFTMYKFRSMHPNAEDRVKELRAAHGEMETMFKLSNDPRVTKVGQFLRRLSLDELPQLFNVLAGSMSLVGPRPPLPAEVDQYEEHARRRLLVTPGLTGLWQVSGRSLLNWEETVRLDLRYVENWTLTLDLLILWKTISAVLARRGAY